MHSARKIDIRVSYYHTGNFAKIAFGISGAAELFRTSDFVDEYTKYVQIGFTQKLGCFGKPYTFEEGIKS